MGESFPLTQRSRTRAALPGGPVTSPYLPRTLRAQPEEARASAGTGSIRVALPPPVTRRLVQSGVISMVAPDHVP
jgi:hypothetical protein